MKRILTNFTEQQLKELDNLVKQNGFGSRSEAIRNALELLIKSETNSQVKKIFDSLKELSPKKHIEQTILAVLEKSPDGLPLSDLSRITHLHRHTIRKYVEKVLGPEIIQVRKIGNKKICFLVKKGRHDE